jgi:hypothetical protein
MMFSSDRAREREAEALAWWKLSQKGLPLCRIDPSDPRMDDIRDDIEVIALLSDWPLMRQTADEAFDSVVRNLAVGASRAARS